MLGQTVTVMRLLFSFPFFPLLAGGKDRKMKKLNDFEYDLWTTEDGRCMVRVRLTREECEVDRETFRLLRVEEKRLRRGLSLPADVEALSPQAAMTQNIKHPLPLDDDDFDEDSERASWYWDPHDVERESIYRMAEKTLLDALTPVQVKIYYLIFANSLSYRECARICGVSYQAVQKSVRQIREKAKKFFQ